MAAYSFIVVGLSQVAGSFVAGAVARAFGVAWAIGGGGAVMLGYAVWAFRAKQSEGSLETSHAGPDEQSTRYGERRLEA
jgi:hypothetical protein